MEGYLKSGQEEPSPTASLWVSRVALRGKPRTFLLPEGVSDFALQFLATLAHFPQRPLLFTMDVR